MQLDLKNAYGQMRRSRTLRAVIRRCPALAPQLAQQWVQGVTWAWTRTDGQWETFLSERGGWQGSPDSNPTFCFGLEDALDDGLQGADGLLRLGYADDTFLDGHPAAMETQWPSLLAALADAGHEVNPTKCNLWVGPPAHRAPADDAAVQRLCMLCPPVTGAITVMGDGGRRQLFHSHWW